MRAAVDVQDDASAIGQVAQTSLRSIIGKSNLDDPLSNREHLNQGLELMIDSPALGRGVQIDRVEIKDVVLPDAMKRSIARQAEAERERRARVITAEGELQASEKLAQAAEGHGRAPGGAATAALGDRRRGRGRRRFPRWCFPSLSNCSGSWNERHHKDPSTRIRRPRGRPMWHRIRTARRRNRAHHGFPTTPAAWNSTHASRTHSSGISNCPRQAGQ